MKRFHDALMAYLQSPDPIFYVRGNAQARRTIVRSRSGLRIAATDNAPAWWAHWVAATPGSSINFASVPTHMFDTRRGTDGINSAGYYVAHILPAKLGPRNPQDWTREQTVARFVCNIHPVNHFYVPMVDKRLGEDHQMIANAAALAATMHDAVWSEFLALAGPEAAAYLNGLPDAGREPLTAPFAELPPAIAAANAPDVVRAAEYSSSRLEFRASVIEPLAWEQRFRVRTPFGTYQFTKREFYETFPSIVMTNSYRVGGRYHGANLHLRAEKFRVA